MYLSALQKYIILQCYERGPARNANASVAGGGKVTRKELRRFYETRGEKTTIRFQEGIITKSLERLINKGLLIGYGRRTPKKWFITDVKLAREGKETAKEILAARQRKLQFRRGK